jgi:RNA polymerase sigma-70 factor, ECF subfamily
MRLARGGRRYSERTVNRSAQADRELVAALRAGDEAAFAWLVDDLSPRLLRTARLNWLGVLKGLDGFEGRAALKTWIFRILMNIAKTRGVRDSRSLPFSRPRSIPTPAVHRRRRS